MKSRKTVVARDVSDSDEESKEIPNPEREYKSADIAAKYSAVEKIGELGLGGSEIKKIKTDESPEDDLTPDGIEKLSKAPVEIKATVKPTPGESDNDSDDDLF